MQGESFFEVPILPAKAELLNIIRDASVGQLKEKKGEIIGEELRRQ